MPRVEIEVPEVPDPAYSEIGWGCAAHEPHYELSLNEWVHVMSNMDNDGICARRPKPKRVEFTTSTSATSQLNIVPGLPWPFPPNTRVRVVIEEVREDA